MNCDKFPRKKKVEGVAMDIASLVGMLLGMGMVVYGIIDSGGTSAFGTFIDVASVAITFGGSLSSTLGSFKLADFINGFKSISLAFKETSTNPSEIIKSIIFGIVEGITEWLPISSTGHMILLDEFIKMDVSDKFREMYLVVIQLGAIMAVVLLFWWRIWPFCKEENFKKHYVKHKVAGFLDNFKFIKQDIFIMWFKIVAACVPAIIVEVAFGDNLEKWFYNYKTVAIMLILIGIVFIIVEEKNKKNIPSVNKIGQITYTTAFWIGMFQLVAAVFPGTSRSGATIIGGLILGLSRTVAAEFTFYLAIPVMFGASLIKIIKFGLGFSALEAGILLTGMLTAFIVSLFVIKFLMGYIKKHDFKVFGWYRIILGVLVLGYFALAG